MQLSNSITASTLTWLSKILEERFGNIFCLRIQPPNILQITLSQDSRSIQLPLYIETFTNSDPNPPCTNWDATAEGWSSVLGLSLPAPGANSLPTPLITPSENGMNVAYDILGLVYWMLSRQEEVGRTDLDEHGRFAATSSHAYMHGYLERPLVDEWLHILGQVIKRVWPEIELKQHNFSIKVSHDVDQPSQYAFKSAGQILRMMGGNLLKRRDPKGLLIAPYVKLTSQSRIHPADPFNSFEWIMDQSDKYGLISAFYFICGYTGPKDADYVPDDPRIRTLMRRIHERGHEIGLHPSYSSFQNPEMISNEAERLKRICNEEDIRQSEWGGRMHYLRWENPTTLQAWSDAGLNYDSTLSYADRPGFRCGTCFEYPAFNHTTQQILPLRIRPLVMMECSVIDETYLGLGTGQAALDKALFLKNACRKVGGVFSLLWHNSNLVYPEQRQLYKRLLIE
jgi:hypothetical protein